MYFKNKLSASQLAALQEETPKVITVLEVVPVVSAAEEWKSRMLHDAARAGLVKMHSPVATIKAVLRKLADILADYPCFPWYARVPSSSNIADAPSRMEPLEFLRERAEEVAVDLAKVLTNADDGSDTEGSSD